MTEPITSAGWTYQAKVTAIYDADTIMLDIDLFDHFWAHDRIIRLYGINAMEIKKSRSKGIDADDVELGFQRRDELMTALGIDPLLYPHKVKYHKLSEPVPVIIQTVKDTRGKFGRYLGIIHKDGININEVMRDHIGGCEFYDGKHYPPDYPIRPK